ncbi:MAG: hypothetical protein Kapaf2KO_01380 [Candidatus Kapaibacteriales bacterium]
MSKDDWETLQLLPLNVFLSVSAADGKIDRAERRAFVTAVNYCKTWGCRLAEEVLEDMKDKYSFSTEYSEKSQEILDTELQKIENILSVQVEKEDALMFRKIMIALGIFIGQSSGKVFEESFTFTEAKALRKLSMKMNVTLDELMKPPSVQLISETLLD